MISPFCEDLFSRNFAYEKFRENKTLAKISKSTVKFPMVSLKTEVEEQIDQQGIELNFHFHVHSVWIYQNSKITVVKNYIS